MTRITEIAMTQQDIDPVETKEWIDSYDALVEMYGHERAHYILSRLLKRAQIGNIPLPALVQTPYVNTIPTDQEPEYPGDERIERRIRRQIRWNSVVMVLRANEKAGLGGHLSTYASAATLYEVGFNHFFRGNQDGLGDAVYFQGHASPGIYARAYLERRLTEEHIDHFRREVVPGRGLSSYPHPTLMPDFWQFPTVSMGLGPIAAIYQARFNRYLLHRGIVDTSNSHVWAFLGDGECDEPESLGALHLASRERLSNLTFVVNCNLQRLDGPVRGNGKIIQELEAVFNGAGWNVYKVIWSRDWDDLLAASTDGALVKRMNETVDGQYQKYSVETGDYIRRDFFGPEENLRRLVENLADKDLSKLRRGGHDFRKVYAAYDAALREHDKPTVILAKTVKGWALGESAEGRNITHQQKKLTLKELAIFRDRLELDVSDRQLIDPPLVRFDRGSEEFGYLIERREALGGFLPSRRQVSVPGQAFELSYFERYLKGSGDQDVSTTAAFARMLALMLQHKEMGRYVVPIIPDEARTFGLDALFRKYGIYSSVGQLYEPVDAHMLLSYREAKDGQVLEEGICEAGSMASFIAAGSAYSTFDRPMIPFYIFYSMFGFQRTGDQIWQAGDQRCRGFLIGATAGRTTLRGEGLQHCDGHSHLMATAFPHIVSYDPAYAYEIAVILQHGIKRMWQDEENVIFYVTVENEGYPMPAAPPNVEQGIIEGMYLLRTAETQRVEAAGNGTSERTRKRTVSHKPSKNTRPRAQLFGTGPILRETLRAQAILIEEFGVDADVWSVTSYSELRREGYACERENMLNPGRKPRIPLIQQKLVGHDGPIVAATDYSQALPDTVARLVGRPMLVLGTDGFGRSDSREALRRFFEVDAESIALAAISMLAREGSIPAKVAQTAAERLSYDTEKPNPATFLP